MARPIWTGVLSFGLVTVPISLYSATESHGVSFRQIERGTADRVRNKRVNERTGEEVPYGDIVKGFELAEGEYVVVEPEELERISPGRSKTIEIRGFVDLDQIEPIYFDTTYYIGPKGKEYAKVYRLLQQAMEHKNKAGLALFSMRGKEYLTAVKSEGGILSAHTMHFADEVRDPRREVDNLPDEEVAVSDRELSTAEQLIDMLAVDWDPNEWHDTYSEQVRELIQAKAEGRETAASEGPAQATNVVDLMDVLSRSLESAGRPGAGPKAKATEEDASQQAADDPRARTRKASTPGRSPKEAGEKKSTSSRRPAKAAAAHKSTSTAKPQEDLSALSKAELYKLATERDLAGRSSMTRDELERALEGEPKKRRLRAVS